MDIESEFNEIVGRAKVGATRLWSSDEKAICWAHDEIERLRARLAAMESQEPCFYSRDGLTGAVSAHTLEAGTPEAKAMYSIPLYAKSVSADKPAVAVPDGWKLAPVEPTEEMLLSARDWSIKVNGIGVGNDQASGCYGAMLAAAPSHSQQSADAVKEFCKGIGLYDPAYDDQGYIEVSRHKLREHVESLYDRCPSHESKGE